MRNKILLLVVIILLPISIYVVYRKKEVKVIEKQKKDIIVSLNYNNENINLSLNDYLIGVVAAEMPATFDIEALKAQAIASRTFLLSNGISDIVKTNCVEQSYKSNIELKDKWQDNYDKYMEKISNAVKMTEGIVMIYDGNIIKSYYYAMSNGYSEDSIIVFNEVHPYIQVVESLFDEDVNNFKVDIQLEKNDFCNKLELTCNEINIGDITYDSSKRVERIVINNKEFRGIDVRKKLGLRSTDFEINIGDNIRITTKGYGHGVGMSQYGANYLAKQNYNYEDILKYYYKDIEIKNYIV